MNPAHCTPNDNQSKMGGVNPCVIIPAYNESKAIAGVVEQVRRMNLHVLVIDDGSDDDTLAKAQAAGAAVLRNPRNLGKGASLIAGFKYALGGNYDSVIIMDGDGQHLPQEIPSFLKMADLPDIDVICGNRMGMAKNMPWVRVLTNKFMSWLISVIIGQKIPDTQCGFRLIKRRALEKINLRTSKYEIESEILIQSARLRFKIESIPIKSVYKGEKSQINPVVDTIRFFKFIIRESWNTRN